ncbi:adhesion G protein-coupled receptor L3-like isoform X2 [Mya arenaria]|uniref:adhesion G protein-coupled receptor L3-like isoform X2 n=1 Tax=Mya arenaria TaxID=6604 RepID=UPI0022E24A4F|nr:adhesion G protein-coupled receptor L3-like isoform X2 [Mya arenaria]
MHFIRDTTYPDFYRIKQDMLNVSLNKMKKCVVIFTFLTEIVVYAQRDGDVRLHDVKSLSRSGLRGTFEIYHKGRWGTLCDPHFNAADARKVCRLIGYEFDDNENRKLDINSANEFVWIHGFDCLRSGGTVSECLDQEGNGRRQTCDSAYAISANCEVGYGTHSVRLYGMSGRFYSMNYPRNYVNNYYCAYYINGPQHSTVCIQFDDFQLEGCCDTVQVFDGPSDTSRSIGNYSGTNGLHVKICSTSSAMTLKLTTDYSISSAGFNASYWIVMHTCSELVITNGYANSTNLFGSNATFNCIEGFNFSGKNVSHCLENLAWSNTNVSCQPKDCGMPYLPNNGQVWLNDSSTTYGSSVLVRCNVGFHVNDKHPEINLRCMGTGKWSSENYTCVPVDCDNWVVSNPTSSSVTYSNSTTYGSKALLRCDLGFHIEHTRDVFTETVTCTANGTWSKRFPPTCVAIECPAVKLPANVNILNNSNLSSQYLVGSIISFGCQNSTSIIGRNSITCLVDGTWSGNPPVCKKVTSEKFCPNDNDFYGQIWNVTRTGKIICIACPNEYIGDISRHCLIDGSWLYPMYNCIHKSIAEISQALQHPTEEDIQINLLKLSNLTSVAQSSGRPAFGGDLNQVTNILDTIANIGENMSVTTEQTESFLSVTSNLLDQQNAKSWQAMGNDAEQQIEHRGAMRVLHVVEKYVSLISEGSGDTDNTSKTFAASNLVVHVAGIQNTTDDGISFPENAAQLGISSVLRFPDKSLKDSKKYSAVFYKNMSSILSAASNEQSTLQRSINTEIVSVNMDNWETNPEFEILITFTHFEKSLSFPTCSFWNDSESIWDSSGCKVVHTNQSHTVCSCSHLTNFAILMSPFIQDNRKTKALDIISIVCCSISILGLVVTVALHIYFHRHMKTDKKRIVVLMNLSTALIISYALFLGGVERTENMAFCTAIAALLHYIYLVVFCLMLAEGVDIFMSVRFVFTTKSKFKWIILAAWAVPAMVVGIALGASRTYGYGTEHFCWLSVESGVIWAFVGPALAVITVNAVILVVVMKTMFGSQAISQKSTSDKSKMAVRCLLILLPLTGITWVLGIFYVNKSMAWVQYVFAVCNSLQGLVIFIFHCALNTQIHDAVLKSRKRRETVMPTKTRSADVIIRRKHEMNSTSMTVIDSSISESEEKTHVVGDKIIGSSKINKEEHSTSSPLQTDPPFCKL